MKKILIADDSLFMRTILKSILSKLSTTPANRCEIIEAASGAEALEQFKKENPGLVLLDIVMPESEEEGIRVLQELKRISPQAQVVMITAVGQDKIVSQCKKLGARDYIVKPFDEKVVTETVGKYLSQ